MNSLAEFENLDIDAWNFYSQSHSLSMFIPGFGIGWGIFSSWSTGVAFAAIALTSPEILAEVHPLTVLFTTPFGLMELVAYSIGMSRSFILIRAIIKKISLVQFLKPTLIEIGIVTGLLLVGGYVEFYMIEQAQMLMNTPEF